jgi:hypothetical protein
MKPGKREQLAASSVLIDWWRTGINGQLMAAAYNIGIKKNRAVARIL